MVADRVEFHGHGGHVELYLVGADGADIIADSCLSVIRQSVNYKVTLVIGLADVCLSTTGEGHVDFHACHARTVGIAHVALHHTGVLAGAFHFVGCVVSESLAVYCRAYLIYIGGEWRDFSVLPSHGNQRVGHHLVGCVGLSLLLAQHLEVIYRITVDVPCQHNAALACLSHDGLAHLTGHLEVELVVRKRCRILGGIRCHQRRLGLVDYQLYFTGEARAVEGNLLVLFCHLGSRHGVVDGFHQLASTVVFLDAQCHCGAAVPDKQHIARGVASPLLLASIRDIDDAEVDDVAASHRTEWSRSVASFVLQTDVHDMSVAVEGALEGCLFAVTDRLSDDDVVGQTVVLVSKLCRVALYHFG